MLSIELIRRDPDLVRKALESRGEEDVVPRLLELDSQRREAITRGDQLRSQRNEVSRQIGQLRSSG
ncbi:MAG TPA: serine--tRNA ligase, partial [Dehalococcoidia bacterium]|nr:serine--tRNA ligase [Dehalococcoidia bacterium]